MSKDALDRLTQTVGFIKAHQAESGLDDEQFAEVVADLDHWMLRKSPATKIKLSNLMSGRTHVSANPVTGAPKVSFDKGGRKFIRAGILLDCALINPEDTWTTRADNQTGFGRGRNNATNAYIAAPQAPFNAACLGARDAVYSSITKIRELIGNLRDDPVEFLNKYNLWIDGGTKDGNPVTYGVWMEDNVLKFGCQGIGTLGHYTIKAANVKGTKYKDIKNAPDALDAVNSGDAAGCDLLFTTQFTGCSFCFMKSADGTNMRAAHIDPGKGADAPSGVELSTEMGGEAGFTNGNGGELKVYGRVPDNSDSFGYPESSGYMIIVGVRNGTEWRLYSQIQGVDGSLRAQRIDA